MEYVSNKPSEGTSFGQDPADKISFYGETPVAQQSGAAQAAVATTAATTTTPHGYSTGTQADGIVTLLNEIRSVLVDTGLMKGSA
jgi:hypothetical protein